jgi:hypothetical protein
MTILKTLNTGDITYNDITQIWVNLKLILLICNFTYKN